MRAVSGGTTRCVKTRPVTAYEGLPERRALRLAMDANPAAGQNYESLSEARTRPSMLDDAPLDRVERVWGDTAADHCFS